MDIFLFWRLENMGCGKNKNCVFKVIIALMGYFFVMLIITIENKIHNKKIVHNSAPY